MLKKCSSHRCNRGAPKGLSRGVHSTAAVDEPASLHSSCLRNASIRASAGICRYLLHSSCRTSSLLAIFCSLACSQHSSPLSLASRTFHKGLALLFPLWVTNVDCLVHLHELVVQVLPSRSLDAL